MSKCKSMEIPLMYIPDSTEKDTEKIRFVSKNTGFGIIRQEIVSFVLQ